MVAGRLFKALNTPYKRLAFVATAFPTLGTAVALLVSGYFYYQVHVGDVTNLHWCHTQIARRELGLDSRGSKVSIDQMVADAANAYTLAVERLKKRSSPEVQQIELGPEYKECIAKSYYGSQLAWSLSWASTLAFWTVAVPILFLLTAWLVVVVRWIVAARVTGPPL